MAEVTVADLIRFLERQDPNMVVRTECHMPPFTREIIEYWADYEQSVVFIQ